MIKDLLEPMAEGLLKLPFEQRLRLLSELSKVTSMLVIIHSMDAAANADIDSVKDHLAGFLKEFQEIAMIQGEASCIANGIVWDTMTETNRELYEAVMAELNGDPD